MSRRGPARLSTLSTGVPASLAVVLMLGLSACGGDDGGASASEKSTSQAPTATPSDEESPTESPTETPDEASTLIDLTREGDRFTPNGARVEATVGEPVVLRITSDEPGELHVHSVPGQEIAYEAGASEHEITIERPGIVEVESHDPDVIVIQLEVR